MGLGIFLRKAKEASAAAPSEPIVRKPDEGAESYDPLHSAADDLKAAIDSGDTASIASALRAAFEICSSYPESEPMGEE